MAHLQWCHIAELYILLKVLPVSGSASPRVHHTKGRTYWEICNRYMTTVKAALLLHSVVSSTRRTLCTVYLTGCTAVLHVCGNNV